MKKHVVEELAALFLETQDELNTDDDYTVLRFMREALTTAFVKRDSDSSLDEYSDDDEEDEANREDLPRWIIEA